MTDERNGIRTVMLRSLMSFLMQPHFEMIVLLYSVLLREQMKMSIISIQSLIDSIYVEYVASNVTISILTYLLM